MENINHILSVFDSINDYIATHCNTDSLNCYHLHVDEDDLEFIHQVRILYKKQGHPDSSAPKHYRILIAKYALLLVDPGLSKPLHDYNKEIKENKVEIYETTTKGKILKGTVETEQEADQWIEENKNAIHDTTSNGRKKRGLPLPVVKITKFESNTVSLAFKKLSKGSNKKVDWYEVSNIEFDINKFVNKAKSEGFDKRYADGILKFTKWEQLLEPEKIGKGGQNINPNLEEPLPEWLGQFRPKKQTGIKEYVKPGPKTIDYNGLNNYSVNDLHSIQNYANIIKKIKLKDTSKEEEIKSFISDNYNGQIITHFEDMDIYLPEIKTGFDFHETLWHLDSLVGKNYHWDKATKAEKNNVRLIQIHEHEWDNKKEIVKSRIKCIIGNCARIFARNTCVKKISQNESSNFLQRTHIQGNYNSTLSYALIKDEQIVACMTFGISRFNKNYDFELLRYSSEINTVVVGGASKLLSHFLKTHQNTKLISYADRRWSNGNLYKTLGFKLEEISHPSHSYYNIFKNELLTRQKMYKKKLDKMFGYSEDKKEHEIMLLNGFERLWDAGQYRFSLDKS